MANGTITVVVIQTVQDGVRERMVRHREAIQRTDNIFRRRPVMMVEGFGASHAAKSKQQHPCNQLS